MKKKVIILDNDPEAISTAINKNEIKFNDTYELDITNFENIENIFRSNKIDSVINLAYGIGTICENNPLLASKINIVGTTSIFEMIIKYKIRRLVFASSETVYGAYQSFFGKKAIKEDVDKMNDNTILIGILNPYENKNNFSDLIHNKITACCMELIPRISRAQSMDVLSSQANLSGYRSVIATISEDKGVELIKIYRTAVTSDTFIKYLELLSKRNDKQPLALFQDQLKVHKSKKVKPFYTALNIVPIYNVGYSPEFNPIESVFSQVKRVFCRERLNKLVNN